MNGDPVNHGRGLIEEWLETSGCQRRPGGESYRVEWPSEMTPQAVVDAMLEASPLGEQLRLHMHSSTVYNLIQGGMNSRVVVSFNDMLTQAEWDAWKEERRGLRQLAIARLSHRGHLAGDVAAHIAELL
jgi:hypothetical protein